MKEKIEAGPEPEVVSGVTLTQERIEALRQRIDKLPVSMGEEAGYLQGRLSNLEGRLGDIKNNEDYAEREAEIREVEKDLRLRLAVLSSDADIEKIDQVDEKFRQRREQVAKDVDENVTALAHARESLSSGNIHDHEIRESIRASIKEMKIADDSLRREKVTLDSIVKTREEAKPSWLAQIREWGRNLRRKLFYANTYKEIGKKIIADKKFENPPEVNQEDILVGKIDTAGSIKELVAAFKEVPNAILTNEKGVKIPARRFVSLLLDIIKQKHKINGDVHFKNYPKFAFAEKVNKLILKEIEERGEAFKVADAIDYGEKSIEGDLRKEALRDLQAPMFYWYKYWNEWRERLGMQGEPLGIRGMSSGDMRQKPSSLEELKTFLGMFDYMDNPITLNNDFDLFLKHLTSKDFDRKDFLAKASDTEI